MTQRQNDLHLMQWLQQIYKGKDYRLTPVAGGASFRRYFRLRFVGGQSFIVMDASPEKAALVSFIAIDRAFLRLGLHVPRVYAQDLDQGFLVLEDFGDDLYFNVLNENNAEQLYPQALENIITIQTCKHVEGWTLPRLDYDFLLKELHEFADWFLLTHLRLSLSKKEQLLLRQTFDFIATTSANQSQVCIHRDYHSQNLIRLATHETGIIDFQSAMLGPITYDLVSLVKDCYLVWPDAQARQWMLAFQQKLLAVGADIPSDKKAFLRDAEIMAVQRVLKAILTFARKFHRDNDDSYLQFIPVALNYIHDIAKQYSELTFLGEFLQRNKEVKE